MSEFGDALWNLKFEARRKMAPVLYKISFSNEQKSVHAERFDSLASGLISLLDSDPTEIKRKLSLDEKQMRDILLLGKLSMDRKLTRKPLGLTIREGQRLLSTVYKASQSQPIDTGNETLTRAFDFLTRSDVNLVVNINADGNLPVSAGIWGSVGAKFSDNVHFIFLAEKPINKEQARVYGSYVDLSVLGGAEVDVYGRGERIDFLGIYKDKDQQMSTTETFLYLGEFVWDSDSGNQAVHCWGHNTKVNTKTLPVRQEERASATVSQLSKIVAS